MEQITKIALLLVTAAGLSACGGEVSDSLGANFSVTDTGIAGDVANENVTIPGIRLDIILGSNIVLN